MIQNRLEKNWKRLKPWADRLQIEAFRLYDRDIPEFPLMIDYYKGFFLIHERTDEVIDQGKNQIPQAIEALKNLFQATDEQIVFKRRERQSGQNQYEKVDETDHSMVIRESQALLKVNLYDYLDTGLFLDHRPMRQTIFKNAKDKKFLNLFCYTASVSVFAALGGARSTTSVDMSATYLDWGKDNFRLNDLSFQNHGFIQMNALEYLESPVDETFDLIFLDPPTFSNSKRMDSTFEVERDQEFLVEHCMKRLSPDGVLYFSNNKRKFRLSEIVSKNYFVRDITERTIPQDFHDQKIHHCFEIRHLRSKA